MAARKERKCNNSDCEVLFIPKSDKAQYCSIACKNRGNYKKKLSEQKFEIEVERKNKKNYYLLKNLHENEKYKFHISFLRDTGYDESAGLLFDKKPEWCSYRYRDLLLKIFKTGDCNLDKFKSI